jgi:two-component system response regulator HydG
MRSSIVACTTGEKIKPVGSNKEIAVDIRIITATNEDLREQIKMVIFVKIYIMRINGFSIDSPSK